MPKALTYNTYLVLICTVVLIWSGINPKEYVTWAMEVAPSIIAFIILFSIRNKFTFTHLVCTLIAIHCIILFVGGKYTYAHVPLFDYIQELFHTKRNNYDKVGHFAQGFIPAMIIRELFLRLTPIKPSLFLSLSIIFISFGISAVYELIEWLAAAIMGGSADEFLSTQGDIWDTQKDMLYCGIGAITALLTLSKWHDKALAKHN